MELNMGVNPAEKKIFRDIHAQLDDSVAELAHQAREYLEVSVETQASWQSSTEALGIWRNRIEDKGISVFKDAFKDDFVDGFSLVHDQFPVIYLNNSRPMSGRFFHSFMSWLICCSGRTASHAASKLEGRKLSGFATDLPLNF